MVKGGGERLRPDKRVRPVNPPGYLATQDLKDRGWTPRLIARFLGEHDQTRENGLRMGRRRLPPVKLYLETRVDEAERDDAFLAAQARAADARERAAARRERRTVERAALLHAAAETYRPAVEPLPIRKGATRQARAPHLPGLEALQAELEGAVGRVTPAESAALRARLLEKLDLALSLAYAWFPAPGQRGDALRPASGTEARPSDWREWDWD